MHIENALSVFDGHSGLLISLEAAGFTVGNYYSSEIDKHAIKASNSCFPNQIRLGDVRNINGLLLPKIGVYGGGSPCQSFSFAGKRKGMAAKEIKKYVYDETEHNIYQSAFGYKDKEDFIELQNVILNKDRFETIEILTLEHYLQIKSEGFQFEGQSYLFWEYVRILRELQQVNPDVYFFLENVEMGEKWEYVISKAIGVKGIHINSALVSAQNRHRIYWTNIGMEPGGLFGDLQSIIPQPKDRGILLKDILESEVDEKYYLSDKAINGINVRKERHAEAGNGFGATITDGNVKSNTILSRYYKDGKEQLIKSVQKDNLIIFHNTLPRSSKSGKGGSGPLSRSDGKTYCLDTQQHNAIEIIKREVVQLNPSKESGGKQPFQQNRIYSVEGIAPALCAHKSDLNIEVTGCDWRTDEGIRYREGVKSGTLAARARNDESCGQLVHIMNKRQSANHKNEDEKSSSLLASCYKGSQANGMTLVGQSRIRRLTPRECGRLQTIPEPVIDTILNSGVSDSQIYKMFGNGWNIETIVHILKYIN